MDYRDILKNALQNTFGCNDYNNNLQREVTEAIYKGEKDVYVSIPNFSEKSLCYQLPVIAKENSFAIIITPKFLLAKEQVKELKKKNVTAYCFSSRTPDCIKNIIINNLRSKNPKMKILYITPEKFTAAYIQIILSQMVHNTLSYLVIDYVHYLSKRKYYSKESYTNFFKVLQKFPKLPIVFISEAPTKLVEQDIFKILKMGNLLTFSRIKSESNVEKLENMENNNNKVCMPSECKTSSGVHSMIMNSLYFPLINKPPISQTLKRKRENELRHECADPIDVNDKVMNFLYKPCHKCSDVVDVKKIIIKLLYR